ncbi:hypothetical protein [Actinomadura rudentiformis]|uniref:Uncharacterized protein n=1 Tax=Actinomadura rudentiformis TaxID=359158 RepID=A0A6H9YQB1_9ACTN|nr:hypothetical protein [Actinomadura rudentiformis]KAB2345936.1 hypothetical protein F8566_24770 [Actinomadura rudentiformis]
MAYAAKFGRTHPTLLIGFSLAPPLWLLLLAIDPHDHGGQFVVALLLLFSATPALIVMAIVYIRRARRSAGYALRVDADGVYFGAHEEAEPRLFTWDEVSALVLFTRRTLVLRGIVRCVGLRLHPYSQDSPERHLADLREAQQREDLEEAERADIQRLIDQLSQGQLEMAVSCHAEARGWRYRSDALRRSFETHAPGVPVAVYSDKAYWDLVGWRAGRDKLAGILETVELRKWR